MRCLPAAPLPSAFSASRGMRCPLPPGSGQAYLPDWFRKLPAIDEARLSTTDTGLTVKRCLPFLDAMTTGWILLWPRRCGWRSATPARWSKPAGTLTVRWCRTMACIR